MTCRHLNGFQARETESVTHIKDMEFTVRNFWPCSGVNREHLVEGLPTGKVKVDVQTTVMVDEKITSGVDSLDVVSVPAIGFKKPRIFNCDEGFQLSVSPVAVLVRWIRISATLFSFLPARRNFIRPPRPMYDPSEFTSV